ncbi:MAG: iminosuccinate reductase BhcD [Cellvibrionaceae bacterium]
MLSSSVTKAMVPEMSQNESDILIVSDDICKDVISRRDAFDAVESVFSAMAKKEARNFPVIRESLGYQDALYGFKSGFDKAGLSLGVKSGGYWPNNSKRGLTNHQSTVFLFDPDTGRLEALVGGNYLTAVRTAAASAVSIAHLAKKEAKVLGIVGAGHQASFQLEAALEQRSFEKVVVWNKDKTKLARLEKITVDNGLVFESLEREALCSEADVIITITSAHEALLMREWIKPGTHIACMGTDTKGKQEIDPLLMISATLFTDELAQSTTIGELQHAVANDLMVDTDITPIGDVINCDHPGRTSNNEITLFDGTGVGLQDLAVASTAMKLAKQQGIAQRVSL